MTKKKFLAKKKSFSTLGFILVNIGCAVGLGNIWRFPKNMVESGGSSYIVIYLIVLLLIVFPLILLEMQYGLFYRRNAVSCFEKSGKTFGRFFGWQQILGTGILCIYYLVIVSWVLSTLSASFFPSFFNKFATDENYFKNNILYNQTAETSISPNNDGIFNLKFSPWILVSGIVLILLLCIVIFTGIKGLEKINMILVPTLFLLMIFLLIYSLTLKNVSNGLNYLFTFETRQLINVEVWFNALKQAIFSTGILFGSFIVFSKSSNIKIDKSNDAIIVIASDTFIGVLSGVMITAMISHNLGQDAIQNLGAEAEQRAIDEHIGSGLDDLFKNSDKSVGSALVFSTLPKVFHEMNLEFDNFKIGDYGIGNFLYLFFLLALFFAAFSSLISLIEVFVDAVNENFPLLTRKKTIISWSILCLLSLGFFSSSIGEKLIDELDKSILLTATIAGLAQVLLFTNHHNFSKVIRKNEKFSYLKLSPFNWFVKICRYIVTPIMLIMSFFGILLFFNLDYYLIQFFPKLKDVFGAVIDYGEADVKLIPIQLTLPKIITWVVLGTFLFFALFLTFNKSENKLKNFKN